MASGLVFCLYAQSLHFGRGRPSCILCSEPILEQQITTFTLPRWMVSGRAEVSKSTPTVRARRPHRRPPPGPLPSTSIRRAFPLHRPPPSAAPPGRGEQREHRRRPSASEPQAERYTPNTRSPAFAASYWYRKNKTANHTWLSPGIPKHRILYLRQQTAVLYDITCTMELPGKLEEASAWYSITHGS